MPKVGNKAFPYTPKGEADAKVVAKKKGKKVKFQPGKGKYDSATNTFK